jgi:tetratricopeptide (TPR) repeat protein
MERAALRMHQFKPYEPESVFYLSQAYLNNKRPALAMKTLETFVARWPNHPHAEPLRKQIEELRPTLEYMLSEMGLDRPDGRELEAIHEEAQGALMRGDYAGSRRSSEKVLKTLPQFAAAWNNISLAHSFESNYKDAIDVSLKVLEFDPQNIHALGNLVHYNAIIGELDKAREFAERLKASEARGSQRELKVAESLSFIGDHAAVIAAYERAHEKDDKASLGKRLNRFAAAAITYLGDEARARELWQDVLEDDDSNKIAVENLADMDLEAGERHGPWAFSQESWFSPTTYEALQEAAIQTASMSFEAAARAFRKLFRQYPDILTVAPLMFAYGDPMAVDLMLDITKFEAPPGLLAGAAAFAAGTRGSESRRSRAAAIVEKNSERPVT